jgi:general stress protein YciG
MPGTKAGALKAKKKNLESNPDFYRVIGKKGRKAVQGKPSGFALNRDRARAAGRKGGLQKGINHRKKLMERDTISSE